MNAAALRELEIETPPGDPRADAELDAFLDACPTSFAQQTTSWRDVIARLGVDEPSWLACRRDGEIVGVLPAYRFAGPFGAILTSVPQAGPLGGVACRDDALREAVYGALLGAFVERARALGCALATVIGNPFWPDGDLCERFLEPDYVLENALLALDLARDVDADGTPLAASSGVRRNLRRARNGALWIDEEQSRANVEEWYAIHARRHEEIGATPLPSELFFGALESMVPRHRARFFFVRLRDGGAMASGGLYLRHAGVVDAYMPSMDARHGELRPNYLLGAHSIAWARAAGCRYYNWQGSPPGSGVERFKRQWGSREWKYGFYTRVTGDASRFLDADVPTLAEAYRWHYALPFDQVGARPRRGPRSVRADVWGALESDARGTDPPRAPVPSDARRAEVVAHYERRLAAHGPTAQGMDWKDAASQRLRFEVLCGICDLNGLTVHEIGCGAGHLADWLRAAGVDADYSGSDASPAMVEAARRAHPGVSFEHRDALATAKPGAWDVVVCSGLFHVKLGASDAEWKAFVEETVRRMFESCRVGIAFNLMSDRVDFRTEALYHSDPSEMLDFCLRELSRDVALRHDYPLYEYTIHVRR